MSTMENIRLIARAPLLKSDVSSTLSLGRLFQQYTSQISTTLMTRVVNLGTTTKLC